MNLYDEQLKRLEKLVDKAQKPYSPFSNNSLEKLLKITRRLKLDYLVFGGSDMLRPRFYNAEKLILNCLEPF